MSLLKPWARSADDRHAIERSARGLIGRSFDLVHYIVPGSSSLQGRRHFSGVDEVDMAVQLTSTNGDVFLAAWYMDGLNEGLAIGGAEVLSHFEPTPIKALDVTGYDEWSTLRASPVESVGLAWHIPNEDCPDTVWSLRLGFQATRSVVIALGEVRDDGKLSYQPDNLVVIFAREIARSYTTPASSEASWGGLV